MSNPSDIVVLRSSTLNIQVFTRLGATNPVLAGGYGGWNVQSRPHRAGITNWDGRNPFGMNLEVWLSEVARDLSVEQHIKDLERLALPSDEFNPTRPPIIRIDGDMLPARSKDIPWTVNDLTWGQTTRSVATGHRIQQNVTIVLLEFVGANLIEEKNQKPGHGNQPKYRTYTVKRGDTLQSIAKALLGDVKRWKELARLNNIHDPRHLTVGQKIRVPRK